MIDLHCHILPGIDDGAANLTASLEMARAFVADGVSVVACTPHILPGLYNNTGPEIRMAVTELQAVIDREEIPLRLVAGADNHIAPDCVPRLRGETMLVLADSRYVLIEPPHHVAPQRLELAFFELRIAGYVPILTHPERLRWIDSYYAAIQRLAVAGVWMQITAGSLAGTFGSRARYWAERMLDERCAHILATDAHDIKIRRPDLSRGRDLAARRLGDEEAWHMVFTRPRGVLENVSPMDLPLPSEEISSTSPQKDDIPFAGALHGIGPSKRLDDASSRHRDDFAGRLRRFFAGSTHL